MNDDQTRNIIAVRDIVFETLTKLKNGDKDFDINRAAVMIKAGEVILKSYATEIAYRASIQRTLGKGGKVVEHGKVEQVPLGSGAPGAEEGGEEALGRTESGVREGEGQETR